MQAWVFNYLKGSEDWKNESEKAKKKNYSSFSKLDFRKGMLFFKVTSRNISIFFFYSHFNSTAWSILTANFPLVGHLFHMLSQVFERMTAIFFVNFPLRKVSGFSIISDMNCLQLDKFKLVHSRFAGYIFDGENMSDFDGVVFWRIFLFLLQVMTEVCLAFPDMQSLVQISLVFSVWKSSMQLWKTMPFSSAKWGLHSIIDRSGPLPGLMSCVSWFSEPPHIIITRDLLLLLNIHSWKMVSETLVYC